MAWLISQSLMDFVSSPSLRELEAESSAANSLAGKQSAPSNESHTPPQCYLHAKTTGLLKRLGRFGMTCVPLTESHGEAVLTSYLAAFPAKTLAPLAKAQDLTARDRDCGQKWRASSEKFSRSSSLSKTALCSLSADWEKFSTILPKWGTQLSGRVYLQRSVAHHISVSEFGLSAYGRVIQWNTPTKTQVSRRTVKSLSKRGKFLIGLNRFSVRPSCLEAQVQISGDLPQTDYMMIEPGKSLEEIMSNLIYKTGLLNPTWTEWLMGWPLGYTKLQPLGTDKLHEWQQQHGNCFING